MSLKSLQIGLLLLNEIRTAHVHHQQRSSSAQNRQQDSIRDCLPPTRSLHLASLSPFPDLVHFRPSSRPLRPTICPAATARASVRRLLAAHRRYSTAHADDWHAASPARSSESRHITRMGHHRLSSGASPVHLPVASTLNAPAPSGSVCRTAVLLSDPASARTRARSNKGRTSPDSRPRFTSLGCSAHVRGIGRVGTVGRDAHSPARTTLEVAPGLRNAGGDPESRACESRCGCVRPASNRLFVSTRRAIPWGQGGDHS
ncbi:hypothetical protein C8T65DRAFT_86623 [Cerioporus squamosus]|nr:hypothetical protein C8T65DRAFT_86623 [Cerioporus squamosus]